MDTYFIDGLRETEEEGIFPVEDDEAEFWTVYRRDHDGFGMAMFDLCIKEEAEKLVQILEERDALLAKQNARQDTPIMYAIIDPYGKPYMSEFCVSPNADDLESEVESLNHDLAWEDSEGGRYVVAPLYLATPAPAVPSFDEWLESTCTHPVGWVREVMEESYNACRAAMLAQPVSSGYKLPGGWMACSDRMPTPFVDVIASDGKQTICAHVIEDRWWCIVSETAEEPGPIIFWMPLPAAPEGGNG